MPATSASPPFEGVGAALITLFHDDGQVDFDGTAGHAAALVARGIQAIVVAGTTGEADALDDAERIRLFATVRAAVPGVPLVAGTGAGTTAQVQALTRAAADAGADAVLARSPRGVADPAGFYQAVADVAGDRPVLAYHYPKVSPPGISLDVLERLPVAGCKDSSGDMTRLLATLDGWNGWLYTGSAALVMSAGLLGCTGAILALANAEPELCLAAFGGSPKAQRQLTPGHLTASASFPGGLKHLVAERFGTSERSRMGRSS
ncbi:MAG TPA: dihydrodipicolinate synthase family protein [Streptosporangiaceae bacterium]|nr:dihydrodipicolinate synthase family protein [Streptosporangiaceae bacterium]